MFGIPAYLELADLNAKFGEKAELMSQLLTVTDIMIFGFSYCIYAYMQRYVSKINYNAETDTLKIIQPFGTEFLNHLETEYKPKDIEKYKR